jgi:hypothetical protein
MLQAGALMQACHDAPPIALGFSVHCLLEKARPFRASKRHRALYVIHV